MAHKTGKIFLCKSSIKLRYHKAIKLSSNVVFLHYCIIGGRYWLVRLGVEVGSCQSRKSTVIWLDDEISCQLSVVGDR